MSGGIRIESVSVAGEDSMIGVNGSIYNDSGKTVSLRILVEFLDSTGQVLETGHHDLKDFGPRTIYAGILAFGPGGSQAALVQTVRIRTE